MRYSNPILSGFYPDPSICRADGDFYLVNSTFAYFPGIPVFHSRDLTRWKQIGNAIHRPGQLCFDGHGISQGLFAPTIRFHKGTFYVICTLINTGGNFIVTAQNPAGPWSDPVSLKDAPGIDPSLFFDEDGRVWYTGTRPAPEGEAYSGNWEIWVQEMDLKLLAEGKNPLTGESAGIWRGALRDCIWPEGPHLYRINGWYYLLHAEGGTSRDHAVCVARSKNIRGPWEGKRGNPVLTHRYLGNNADIVNAGHADIVDDTEGNWWMILLASRPFYGVCPLGRETFMVPLAWEDGWPRVASKTGLIEEEVSLPAFSLTADTSALADAPAEWAPESACDHFDGKLPLHWLVLRMPVNEKDAAFSLLARNGYLRLFTKAPDMRGKEHPAFAGRRVRHKNWFFKAAVEFFPKETNETAGIILLQSEDWQYRFEIFLAASAAPSLRLVCAKGKEDEAIQCEDAAAQPEHASQLIKPGKSFILAASCEEMKLSFYYGEDQYSLKQFASGIDGRILSTEYAGGFVGTLAGVFASGNGRDTENYCDVFWAEYTQI